MRSTVFDFPGTSAPVAIAVANVNRINNTPIALMSVQYLPKIEQKTIANKERWKLYISALSHKRHLSESDPGLQLDDPPCECWGSAGCTEVLALNYRAWCVETEWRQIGAIEHVEGIHPKLQIRALAQPW